MRPVGLLTAGAVVLVTMLAVLLHGGSPAHGADRIARLMISAAPPHDCAHANVTKPSQFAKAQPWYASTTETADIDCEYLGGSVAYARFANTRDRDAAMSAIRSSATQCSLATEIVIVTNPLYDASAMRDLCKRLNGRLTVS